MHNESALLHLFAGWKRGIWIVAFLVASGLTAHAQCNLQSVNFWGRSLDATRPDAAHIRTESQSWVEGDVLALWRPYVSSLVRQDGNDITQATTSFASPGLMTWNAWTINIPVTGPGSFRDYSNHYFVPYCYDATQYNLGYTQGIPIAISRPRIGGRGGAPAASAFWYLGNVLSDRAYYAQAQWAIIPNGAAGTPVWRKETTVGHGDVSFSCTQCLSTVATSLAPSPSCAADLIVIASYDGFDSDPLPVTIVMPSVMTLSSGFPKDTGTMFPINGFQSDYEWQLTDTCGYPDAGLDGYEQFGAWTRDYPTNIDWNIYGFPPFYNSTNVYTDVLSQWGALNPKSLPQQNPLSTVKVVHNTQWTAWLGSQSPGMGLIIMSDTQQWYLDHGRHEIQ